MGDPLLLILVAFLLIPLDTNNTAANAAIVPAIVANMNIWSAIVLSLQDVQIKHIVNKDEFLASKYIRYKRFWNILKY
jgi:hypothetical protein